MSMAEEAVYEDQTHIKEYEEVEEAVLEELLQEAEEAALEQELSEQDPNTLEEDSASEDTDHDQSEEGETSSQEDSTLLEASELAVDVEDINGANEVEWENPEVIEIVEEEIVEETSDIENVIEEEVEVEEHDSALITIEEFELNGEAQELLEDQAEDQIEGFLEENEVQEPEEIDEVTEITELEQHDDHVELEDVEDVVHQDDLEEVPDVEELDQHDDYIELEEEEVNTDELLDLEETEESQIIEQGDVVDLQGKQEEEGFEEDLIDNEEKNLDNKIEEQTDLDDLEVQTEEFENSVLKPEEQLEETNGEYAIEEPQPTTLNDTFVPADIETLEKEFSQVPEEYQSVFTPQEQFLARFAADLSLFETVLAKQEHQISATTVSEKHELLTPSPYTVSFNEELLPPISLDHFDEEISSIEEELAQIESPRAFQHFHEQLQESQLQVLTIDPQLSLENLADDMKLVSQRESLPEPPPYDFLAELESYEDSEAEAQLHELRNPLYPYSTHRYRLRALNRTKHNIVHSKAATNSTQSQEPKVKLTKRKKIEVQKGRTHPDSPPSKINLQKQDLLMKDQNRIKQGSLEYLQKRRTFFGQRIASDAKFLIKINEKIKKLQKSGNLEIDNEGRVKIRLTKTFETAKTLKNKTIVELRNMRRAIIDEWNIPKTAFQFQKDKMNYKVHSNSKRWAVNLNPKVLKIKTVRGSGGTIVWIKPEGVERELQRLRKTFLAITEKIRKDTEYRKAFVNNKIKQAQEIRDIYEKIAGRNFDEDTKVVSNLFDQQKYMRILHIKTLNSPKSLLKHILTKTNSLTKANTKFMKIMSIDDTENIIKENIVVEEVLKKHFRYSKPTTKCPKGLPYYDDVVNGIRNFNVFHETQGGIQTFVGNIRSGMAKIVDEINKINVRKSTEEIEAAIERVGYEISPLIRYMRLKIKNPTNVKIKYHVGGQSSKGVTGIAHYSCDGLIYEGKNLLGIIQIKVIGKNPHVTPSNIVFQTLELLYLKIKYQVPVAVVAIDKLDDGKTLIYKWSCTHPLTKEASEINFKKFKRSLLDVMLFKGFQHDIIKNSILQPILENSIGKPLLSLKNALKNITDEDLWKVLRDTAENIFEDTFILEASSVKKYFDEFIDELIPSLTKRNLKDWNHFNEAWNTLLAKYFFRKYRIMTREIMIM